MTKITTENTVDIVRTVRASESPKGPSLSSERSNLPRGSSSTICEHGRTGFPPAQKLSSGTEVPRTSGAMAKRQAGVAEANSFPRTVVPATRPQVTVLPGTPTFLSGRPGSGQASHHLT